MRKILMTLTVLIAVIIVFLATWIFYGHRISLLLDRFGTIEMTQHELIRSHIRAMELAARNDNHSRR